MSISRLPAWGDFVRSFNRIASHRHRYEVFRDFVTMAAIAMHNAIRKNAALEDEYLKIVKRYERDQVTELCGLFAKLVLLLDAEPQDVLGPLYMELELGNTNTGQFFTPHEISELMARLTYGEELKTLSKPFITLSEPACGAGGMVLAFVKVMLSHGHDPAKRLWVQCQDVDRTAALMCYLQLSLWNVPAVVIVGNTLAMEVREVFYTPAHHLGFWTTKLRLQEIERMAASSDSVTTTVIDGVSPANEVRMRHEATFEIETLSSLAVIATTERPVQAPIPPIPGRQLGFDFEL